MSNHSNSRKGQGCFCGFGRGVGCMLVGEESERILVDLGDCPQADLGRDLLAAALTYLRGIRK